MSAGAAKFLAGAASIALHAAMATTLLSAAEPVETKGGGSAVQASLGSSFANMAVGTMTAETVTEAVEPLSPTPPDETVPTTPDAVEPSQPAETARKPDPDLAHETRPQADTARAPSPQTTERAASTVPQAADVPPNTVTAPEAARPTAPIAAVTPEEPLGAEAAQASPLSTAEAVAPDASASPSPELETITSMTEDPGRVLTSPRPAGRTTEFERRNRQPDPPPTQRAERIEEPPLQTSRGDNKERSARAGSDTGSREAAPAQARQGAGRNAAAGNSAASNYGGAVMQQLSRVPRPRSGNRGTAVVTFRIASNGGLAGVSLARSSGSGALDNAAVQLIRRAAPFPPPPTGARTSYQIAIEGR